jgi:hypothetical protein
MTDKRTDMLYSEGEFKFFGFSKQTSGVFYTELVATGVRTCWKVEDVYAWWHDAQIMGFWTGKHSRQPLKQGMTLEESVKERGNVLMNTANSFRRLKTARTQTDVELPPPEGGN